MAGAMPPPVQCEHTAYSKRVKWNMPHTTSILHFLRTQYFLSESEVALIFADLNPECGPDPCIAPICPAYANYLTKHANKTPIACQLKDLEAWLIKITGLNFVEPEIETEAKRDKKQEADVETEDEEEQESGTKTEEKRGRTTRTKPKEDVATEEDREQLAVKFKMDQDEKPARLKAYWTMIHNKIEMSARRLRIPLDRVESAYLKHQTPATRLLLAIKEAVRQVEGEQDLVEKAFGELGEEGEIEVCMPSDILYVMQHPEYHWRYGGEGKWYIDYSLCYVGQAGREQDGEAPEEEEVAVNEDMEVGAREAGNVDDSDTTETGTRRFRRSGRGTRKPDPTQTPNATPARKDGRRTAGVQAPPDNPEAEIENGKQKQRKEEAKKAPLRAKAMAKRARDKKEEASGQGAAVRKGGSDVSVAGEPMEGVQHHEPSSSASDNQLAAPPRNHDTERFPVPFGTTSSALPGPDLFIPSSLHAHPTRIYSAEPSEQQRSTAENVVRRDFTGGAAAARLPTSQGNGLRQADPQGLVATVVNSQRGGQGMLNTSQTHVPVSATTAAMTVALGQPARGQASALSSGGARKAHPPPAPLPPRSWNCNQSRPYTLAERYRRMRIAKIIAALALCGVYVLGTQLTEDFEKDFIEPILADFNEHIRTHTSPAAFALLLASQERYEGDTNTSVPKMVVDLEGMMKHTGVGYRFLGKGQWQMTELPR